MNKTTLNQSVITPKSRTSLFLTMLLALCSVVSFAQLKVNANTVFTANNVVSSKEDVNVFDASVLGNSQVVVNGQNQYLETAQNVSLPTLKVADANELTISTELKLRGDLMVESGILKLEHPVHVEGKVILGDDVLVYNEHFIIYENQFLFQKDATSPATFKMGNSSPLIFVTYKSITHFPTIVWEEPITSINEHNVSQFKAPPFSPPPEVV